MAIKATVLLLVFLLSATVVVSESKGTFRFAEVDSNMSLKDDFINHLNASDQGLEDSIANFFNNSRSKLLNALKNFSSYLPISVEYAMTKGQNCDIIKYNKPFYHVIPLILAAVIIVLGAVFTYVGYRLMKIVLFLIGFLVGGSIMYFIIVAFIRDRPETWLPYVAIVSAVIVGLLCGLLTICIYYIGMFLAGGSVGFLVVWFILSAINVEFFHTHIYVPIIIAVIGGIIAGVITMFIQKWFFMFGITVLGSFLIIWGLDYYLELGAMIYFLFLFAENRTKFKPCWYSWSIIPLFVILFISGILIQACVTGRKYDHREDFDGICCGLCNKKKRQSKKVDKGGKYMELKNQE